MAARGVRSGVAPTLAACALERSARALHRWTVGIFPDTRPSLVLALAEDDATERERALDLVLRAYRGPVIEVLRRQWRLEPADAEDLAHDFFAQALAKEWLRRFDPARGRFRTFLRSCLRAYASDAHDRDSAQKRGGHLRAVSFDTAEPALTTDEPDDAFDREWARSVLGLALDALKAECDAAGRALTFQVFVACDVEGTEREAPATYSELARRFDLPVTQVANYLHWARQRFRRQVLDTLRALTSNEAEFRAETRALLGRATP